MSNADSFTCMCSERLPGVPSKKGSLLLSTGGEARFASCVATMYMEHCLVGVARGNGVAAH